MAYKPQWLEFRILLSQNPTNELEASTSPASGDGAFLIHSRFQHFPNLERIEAAMPGLSPFVHGAGTSPGAARPSREQAHLLLAATSTAHRLSLRQSRSPCRTSGCHLRRLTWAPPLPA